MTYTFITRREAEVREYFMKEYFVEVQDSILADAAVAAIITTYYGYTHRAVKGYVTALDNLIRAGEVDYVRDYRRGTALYDLTRKGRMVARGKE